MVESLIELPLPGRTFARRAGLPDDDVTLPSFVAGPENRLVAATLHRLLDVDGSADESSTRISLFMLHGPSGTGKTHLARGLVQHLKRSRPPRNAEYLTASDFRRQLIDAIDTHATSDFRARIRTCELLALDDLDHLPGEPHLLEELRNSLDALEARGSLVIATASRAAPNLPNLTPDLRSRLAAGLTLQLAPPGSAARRRLIEQAASAMGRTLSTEATDGLAEKISGTATELFGAILELCAADSGCNSRSAISDKNAAEFLVNRASRCPALREIIAVVAKYYRVPQKVLKSDSRKKSAVYARATAVFLARELAGASYENIGKALGGRDHTTIMHNFRKIQRELAHDVASRQAIEELRRILLCR